MCLSTAGIEHVQWGTRDHDPYSMGMKPPVIVKPMAACGAAHAHKMALALGAEYQNMDVPLPAVASAFIDHSGILHKLYILGDQASRAGHNTVIIAVCSCTQRYAPVHCINKIIALTVLASAELGQLSHKLHDCANLHDLMPVPLVGHKHCEHAQVFINQAPSIADSSAVLSNFAYPQTTVINFDSLQPLPSVLQSSEHAHILHGMLPERAWH